MTDWGDLCRRLRERKTWGPLELAEKLGLTRTEVVLVEQGERLLPPRVHARLERLAARWRVPLVVTSKQDDPAVPPPVVRRHRNANAPSGEAIRAWRKGRAWSQERLGQELGVTGMCVSLWETGRTVPSEAVGRALGMLMAAAA